MKIFGSLIVLVCTLNISFGQTDLKLGLLPIIGTHLNLQFEQGLSNKSSLLIDGNFRLSGLFNTNNSGQNRNINHFLGMSQYRYYFSPKIDVDRFYSAAGVGLAYMSNGFEIANDLVIPLSVGWKNSLFGSTRFYFELEYGLLWLPFQVNQPISQLTNEYGWFLNDRTLKDGVKIKFIYRI